MMAAILPAAMAAILAAALWVRLWPRLWPKPPRRWPRPDAATLVLGGAMLLPLPLVGSVALGCFAPIAAALAGLDLRRGLLPDAPVLALAALGALLVAADALPLEPWQALAGAALGGGLFAAVRLAFRRLAGREGMGQGDVTLAAALGLWTGPFALPWVIVAAALAGLAWAGLRPPGRRASIPFGPCLILAAWALIVAREMGLPGMGF